jgi:3-methyladenine DNA glycosylase AlkD
MKRASDWIEALKEAFVKEADAERAPKMAAYMKNNFSFIGLSAPVRRKIQSIYFKNSQDFLKRDWRSVVELLWRENSREFQYTAIDLMVKYKRNLEISDIQLLEKLIIQKSWWDSVDLLAGHLVGIYFQKYPDTKQVTIQRWDASGNLWLLRSVLIFQLKYKAETDSELLFKYCVKYAENKNFFIRKAIGWALRELAKTSPESVFLFVNETNLAELSKREALKHLMNSKS